MENELKVKAPNLTPHIRYWVKFTLQCWDNPTEFSPDTYLRHTKLDRSVYLDDESSFLDAGQKAETMFISFYRL